MSPPTFHPMQTNNFSFCSMFVDRRFFFLINTKEKRISNEILH
jgi:hypothetical protein